MKLHLARCGTVAVVAVVAAPDMRTAQAGAEPMAAVTTATSAVVVVARAAPMVVVAEERLDQVRAALQALLRTTSHRPPCHVWGPSRLSPGRFSAPSWYHG